MTGSPEIFRASFVMDVCLSRGPGCGTAARRVTAGPSGESGTRGRDAMGRIVRCERFPHMVSQAGCPGGPGMAGAFRGIFQRKWVRRIRPGRAPCGAFSPLPGENTEKACQRRASSVDASLRCGKSTDALWQGSSVGQSMRFIPAVSGVQIPPLLPEEHKRFGSVPGRFFRYGLAACEHCGTK